MNKYKFKINNRVKLLNNKNEMPEILVGKIGTIVDFLNYEDISAYAVKFNDEKYGKFTWSVMEENLELVE